MEQQPARTLRPGNVGVIDEISAHQVAGVRQTVLARRARLLYLAPHSPGPHPVEQVLAGPEALPRKVAARAGSTLWAAIGTLPEGFPVDGCPGDSRHTGHGSTSTGSAPADPPRWISDTRHLWI